jgi:hypothetical protein
MGDRKYLGRAKDGTFECMIETRLRSMEAITLRVELLGECNLRE